MLNIFFHLVIIGITFSNINRMFLLRRRVRIQLVAHIYGCCDWSHALVLFTARSAGKRPVILILLIIDVVATPAHRYEICSAVKDGSE